MRKIAVIEVSNELRAASYQVYNVHTGERAEGDFAVPKNVSAFGAVMAIVNNQIKAAQKEDYNGWLEFVVHESIVIKWLEIKKVIRCLSVEDPETLKDEDFEAYQRYVGSLEEAGLLQANMIQQIAHIVSRDWMKEERIEAIGLLIQLAFAGDAVAFHSFDYYNPETLEEKGIELNRNQQIIFNNVRTVIAEVQSKLVIPEMQKAVRVEEDIL